MVDVIQEDHIDINKKEWVHYFKMTYQINCCNKQNHIIFCNTINP